MKMDTLYIVIPAYNEEENIEKIINDWHPIVEKTGKDSRLVIIDDGSKDSTLKVMERCSKTRSQLEIMTKENGGHGATLLFGYEYALEKGADYVFQTDSDGQTVPEEFWPFWDERKNYEMIVGERKKRGDGLSRIFVTKILKLVIWLCFHVKVKDANTPYRLMEGSILKKEIGLIPKDFFLTNVLLNVIYTKHRRKVKYIPITFKPRQGGTNSIHFKKIVKIGIQSLKDFKELNERI